MTPRINTRMYTNVILTVIAMLLTGVAAQQLGLNILGSAKAQSNKYSAPNMSQTATGAVIDSTIPQTQDVAVAQATMAVADSNRDIAAAIRELAAAVKDGTSSIRSAATSAAPAASSSSAARPSSSAEPVARPSIEVK